MASRSRKMSSYKSGNGLQFELPTHRRHQETTDTDNIETSSSRRRDASSRLSVIHPEWEGLSDEERSLAASRNASTNTIDLSTDEWKTSMPVSSKAAQESDSVQLTGGVPHLGVKGGKIWRSEDHPGEVAPRDRPKPTVPSRYSSANTPSRYPDSDSDNESAMANSVFSLSRTSTMNTSDGGDQLSSLARKKSPKVSFTFGASDTERDDE